MDIGPLSGMIGYALRRAQLAVFDDVIGTLSELSLRPAEFSTLLVLATSPGRSQSAIAASIGIQRANFVALIKKLEARGLAERCQTPGDRRSRALYLTREGHAVLETARVAVAQHEQRQIARVGAANTALLLDLLTRLAAPTASPTN